MKCRHFLSFVFVALLVFFSGLFITTQNSFAVADLSVSYSSSDTFSDNMPVFSNCSGTCLSDYHFLKIEGYNLYNPRFGFRFVINGVNNNLISPRFQSANFTGSLTSVILSLPEFISSSDNLVFYYSSSSSVPFEYNYTFTLLSSLGGSTPSGDLSITENGTYDVSSYATATVDVPAESVPGDYHDDLVNIKNSIIICGAILLVLYFFYCIYRLIIKNSGVH